MKLIIAVVQDKDSPRLAQNLVKASLRATKLASTGGFLHAGNTTFLIGTTDDKVDEIKAIIKSSCQSREQVMMPMSRLGSQLDSYIPYAVTVQVGGATVFVVEVADFEQF